MFADLQRTWRNNYVSRQLGQTLFQKERLRLIKCFICYFVINVTVPCSCQNLSSWQLINVHVTLFELCLNLKIEQIGWTRLRWEENWRNWREYMAKQRADTAKGDASSMSKTRINHTARQDSDENSVSGHMLTRQTNWRSSSEKTQTRWNYKSQRVSSYGMKEHQNIK